MHHHKDIQGFGHLLKGVILPLNEVAQPLYKEWVSPPHKDVITPLLNDVGHTS